MRHIKICIHPTRWYLTPGRIEYNPYGGKSYCWLCFRIDTTPFPADVNGWVS